MWWQIWRANIMPAVGVGLCSDHSVNYIHMLFYWRIQSSQCLHPKCPQRLVVFPKSGLGYMSIHSAWLINVVLLNNLLAPIWVISGWDCKRKNLKLQAVNVKNIAIMPKWVWYVILEIMFFWTVGMWHQTNVTDCQSKKGVKNQAGVKTKLFWQVVLMEHISSAHGKMTKKRWQRSLKNNKSRETNQCWNSIFIKYFQDPSLKNNKAMMKTK